MDSSDKPKGKKFVLEVYFDPETKVDHYGVPEMDPEVPLDLIIAAIEKIKLRLVIRQNQLEDQAFLAQKRKESQHKPTLHKEGELPKWPLRGL